VVREHPTSSPLHVSRGRETDRDRDEDDTTLTPFPEDEEACASPSRPSAAFVPGSPQTILSDEESIFAPDSDFRQGDESDEEEEEQQPADLVG
jgi:hypothetical protein